MKGRGEPVWQPAEEAQGLSRGDQAGRGGRKGQPLPQGGEDAAAYFSVSTTSLRTFVFLY